MVLLFSKFPNKSAEDFLGGGTGLIFSALVVLPFSRFPNKAAEDFRGTGTGGTVSSDDFLTVFFEALSSEVPDGGQIDLY